MKTGAKPLIAVARIIGAFGVRGEVKLKSYTEAPLDCAAYGPVFDKTGGALFAFSGVRKHGESVIAKTEPVFQREHWLDMRGTELFIPREALPDLDEEDDAYVEDLVDLRVTHTDGRALGRVKAIENFGAGDLLDVQPETGPSFYIPYSEDVVLSVDLEQRAITVDPHEDYLPEGLQRHSSDDGTKR